MTSVTRQRQILLKSVRIIARIFNVSCANGVAVVTHTAQKLESLYTNHTLFSLTRISRFCVENISHKLVAPIFRLELENTLLAKCLPD